MRACLAELGPSVDFEQASDEELGEMRQIRSHAAILAMHGIAIMIMYFGALRQSMLRRVHVATRRPREAGGLDAAADAVVPTIARLYFRSRLLLLLLPYIKKTSLDFLKKSQISSVTSSHRTLHQISVFLSHRFY